MQGRAMTRDRDPMDVALMAECNPRIAELWQQCQPIRPHDVADDEPHPATHGLEESE